MQETTDYTPRPFDLQSLDGSLPSSTPSTPPPAPATPSALTLSATLIATLNQLSTVLEAAQLKNPEDLEVGRKVALLERFRQDVLSDGADSELSTAAAGGVEVETAIEKEPDQYKLAQDSIAASNAQREETLRMFDTTLDKSFADKNQTLQIMQHDHEETIRRLMQAHEETIRNVNHEREETNRRLVQDIASMVRQERGQ